MSTTQIPLEALRPRARLDRQVGRRRAHHTRRMRRRVERLERRGPLQQRFGRELGLRDVTMRLLGALSLEGDLELQPGAKVGGVSLDGLESKIAAAISREIFTAADQVIASTAAQEPDVVALNNNQVLGRAGGSIQGISIGTNDLLGRAGANLTNIQVGSDEIVGRSGSGGLGGLAAGTNEALWRDGSGNLAFQSVPNGTVIGRRGSPGIQPISGIDIWRTIVEAGSWMTGEGGDFTTDHTSAVVYALDLSVNRTITLEEAPPPGTVQIIVNRDGGLGNVEFQATGSDSVNGGPSITAGNRGWYIAIYARDGDDMWNVGHGTL